MDQPSTFQPLNAPTTHHILYCTYGTLISLIKSFLQILSPYGADLLVIAESGKGYPREKLCEFPFISFLRAKKMLKTRNT